MRKIRKINIKIYIIMLLIIQLLNICGGSIKVLAYTKETSKISYSIERNPDVNEVFKINVNIENFSDLYGASLDFVYDSSLIKIDGIENGDIFDADVSIAVNKVNKNETNFAVTMKGNTPGITKKSGKLFSIKASFLKESKLTLKTTADNEILVPNGKNVRIKLSNSKAQKIDYISEELIIDSEINNILPFVGRLDTPKSGAEVKDTVKVQGWYLYGKEIEKVEILIDGQVTGVATRSRRDDVGAVYPGYDISKAGYTYNLDTTKLTNGNHILEVKATGINGKTDIITRTINVQNEVILPFVGRLDTPKSGAEVKDTVRVQGWYLYGKEIEKVEILIDGQVTGVATRSRRDDVGAVYQGYDISKAGYIYSLDTTKLTNGNHILEVKATGINGKTDIITRTINVQNEVILPFRKVLDTPKNLEVVKDTVKVQGWYLYGKEIEKVEILIDGQVTGAATRARRDDVGAVYPGYDISKAGYIYSLDTTKLINGNHKLEVKATGINGKTDIISSTINVQNEVILPFRKVLDTPKNLEVVKDTVKVQGWYLYGKEIEKVEILIDGQVTGVATRSRRDDVGAVYPGYDISKAGYTYSLDTTKLINGNHKLEVKATGINGKTDIISSTINVQNEVILPFRKVLDTPKNLEVVKDTVKVQGWYLYGKEIEKIEILIDGQVTGTAIRSRRDDVGAVYPGYDISKAGYIYNLDTTKLSNGNHKLEVKATGINGKTDIISSTINVQNEVILPFRKVLDTPKNLEVVKDTVKVQGWYLYGKEIEKVEILIDGQVTGVATRSRRDDVGAVYPGYDISKAGYIYSLDTTKLINGNHKLEVKATGINGKADIISSTINVQN